MARLSAKQMADPVVDTFASGSGPFSLTRIPEKVLAVMFGADYQDPTLGYYTVVGNQFAPAVGVDPTNYATMTVIYA